MSRDPLVSVLITTFNHEPYVEETIHSVLDQTYRNLEVVVADDGSEDGTADIVRQIAAADSRVVPLCSPVNCGMSVNWNRAWDRCRGEYIATLAGDDVMLPAKLATQVSFLEHHPDCGVCSHDMEVFDSRSGATLYRFGDRFRPLAGGPEIYFSTSWFFGREMKSIPSSHLYRASYGKRFRYDERFRIWNEWLHSIDLLATSPLRWTSLPQVLGRYRVHDQQTSRSAEAHARGLEESLMVLAIAASRYPQLGRYVKNKRDFMLFQHLVFDWVGERERADRERQFRGEAGWVKWLYMRSARFTVRHQWLMQTTRPARRIVQSLLNRS